MRRIAIIGPSRDAITEPFSGGLAAHVWALTRHLVQRGHDVTLFAAAGTDPSLPWRPLDLGALGLSDDARADVSMPPDLVLREHHAYLRLMLELGRHPDRFDLIHNHSLHHLPVAMAPSIATPIVTTLHTPPTPWLESAIQTAPDSSMRFVAVSRHTADRWRPLLPAVGVVGNGIDLDRWPVGRGGTDVVWTGRLVPEKAPHLAIRAARLAGRCITLAGPISDPAYYREHVLPALGSDAVHVGHLTQAELAHLVGGSAVALATPMWNEPYGLVVAEALACGTPVAGFARGGMVEVVDDSCARLVSGGDVPALARAIDEAALLSRCAARARAETQLTIERMVQKYETLFGEVMTTVAA